MMKLPRQIIRAAKCSILVFAVCVMGSLSARCDESQAPGEEKAKTKSEKPDTAVEQKQLAIPQSTFVIPSSPAEGRDPFFPNLTHQTAPVTPVKNTQPVKSGAEDLVLQGISGQVDRRLCVINDRTLAVGNEEDIPVSSGTVRVRCLEINETFVVIELGGTRRELHFKTQK